MVSFQSGWEDEFPFFSGIIMFVLWGLVTHPLFQGNLGW